MKRPGPAGEQDYDSIRCVHAYTRTLLVERDDDGHWTERIVGDALSQLAPVGQPNQTAGSAKKSAPSSPFLRTEEAAAYTRAGKKRLLAWVRRGLLPETVDPDGRRFFKTEDLDAVMGSGPVPPEPIARTSTPKRKEIRKHESWLHPVQPRTKPRDPERR